jgi:hypothetical protein
VGQNGLGEIGDAIAKDRDDPFSRTRGIFHSQTAFTRTIAATCEESEAIRAHQTCGHRRANCNVDVFVADMHETFLQEPIVHRLLVFIGIRSLRPALNFGIGQRRSVCIMKFFKSRQVAHSRNVPEKDNCPRQMSNSSSSPRQGDTNIKTAPIT